MFLSCPVVSQYLNSMLFDQRSPWLSTLNEESSTSHILSTFSWNSWATFRTLALTSVLKKDAYNLIVTLQIVTHSITTYLWIDLRAGGGGGMLILVELRWKVVPTVGTRTVKMSAISKNKNKNRRLDLNERRNFLKFISTDLVKQIQNITVLE